SGHIETKPVTLRRSWAVRLVAWARRFSAARKIQTFVAELPFLDGADRLTRRSVVVSAPAWGKTSPDSCALMCDASDAGWDVGSAWCGIRSIARAAWPCGRLGGCACLDRRREPTVVADRSTGGFYGRHAVRIR